MANKELNHIVKFYLKVTEEKAATLIQAVVRTYNAKKRYTVMKEEERKRLAAEEMARKQAMAANNPNVSIYNNISDLCTVY